MDSKKNKTTTTRGARRTSLVGVASLVWLVLVATAAVMYHQFSSDTASTTTIMFSVSAFQHKCIIQQPACLLASKARTDTTATPTTTLMMAAAREQIGEPEAKKAIDKVVQALRKDSTAKNELGSLKKVENVLGYGSPKAGTVAVRFNASFQKGGKGFLGMGGGKAKDGDQRGTMVGQVKASVDKNTGKVLQCSVFRDLGYGRSFDLKI